MKATGQPRGLMNSVLRSVREHNGNENEGGSGDEHLSDEDVDADMEDLDHEGELDPAKHPLLQPGAMPRMSRAALEMAVGVVENAFFGTTDQEDELDD